MRTLKVGLLGLLLLAISAEAQAQKLVIGQGFLNTNGLPLWIAVDQGFFKKHGLDVELTLIRGGGRVMAALMSGEMRFVSAALSQVVGPVSQGADPAFILAFVKKLPYLFMTASHIRNPEDLKGKKIGVATFGGAAYVASHIVLRQFGLDPKRDQITLIQIGTEPERVAALIAGSIDAAMIASEMAGRVPTPPFRTMLDLRTSTIPWLHTGFITTRSFMKANPRTAEAAVRAIIESLDFIFDPKNKEAVKQSLAKHLKLDKAGQIEDTYKDALDHLTTNPAPSPEAGATLLKLMAELEINKEASRLKPQDLMDGSIVEKLEREGVLENLRRR
jgi:NitT/TauT family transport system substrate-binding protein